ncbi:EamA family transporter [Pelagicoccus sp. SDUM812002]|uniref:EamA family transporter n=1 Tax=Pelagicoccus sp. SDUM812002 TaxID=3041266 RepID=UPI00280D9D91|nr:EamA family transporter [Pelagicoccus sp. SDUM812002]MDQ8186410.1 EamA family transporter [Pelagicoccus sp. SDUM812002]
MLFLIAVSLLWAFSFGIMGRLTGLDSTFVATVRLGIAFLCFAPFFRFKKLQAADLLSLFGIGALQYGVMYVSYIKAYAFLPSHLVALFSVLTPLYIVLAHEMVRRRWHWSLLGCASLSIAGAAVIKYSQAPEGSFWIGFALMQIANVAFGIGQLLYRSWKRPRPEVRDSEAMAALLLGGAILAGIGFGLFGDSSKTSPSHDQWYVLFYLGAIASGLGFFWWNKGAALSSPGVLATCNNAVVPLAMAVSLFIFGEAGDITADSVLKLTIGAVLIFAAIAWGKKASMS